MKARIKELLLRGERGATAVIVALSIVLLFGAGAVGFDIAQLVNARQQVRGAIDAAAQAAAVDLPASMSQAITDANKIAHANYSEIPDGALTIKFYCVVANKSGVPDESQIPGTCNPGTKGTDWTVASANCTNASVCAIPITYKSGSTLKANTLAVSYELTVQFVFGPAINVPTGTTGAQSTASCVGTCGGEAAANPMDVVVMADRTPSMNGLTSTLASGIENMLAVMNPEQQYVALGTIAKSMPTSSCLTAKQTTAPTYNYKNGSYNYTGTNPFPGSWVPVSFSSDYGTLASDGSTTVNTSSTLYKSLECLKKNEDDDIGWTTYLAAAMKGAARYLYGSEVGSTNNISSLPDRTSYGTVKKVIIFETDGSPMEYFNTGSSLALTTNSDPGAGDATSSTHTTACNNLLTVADNVKSMHDSMIITIAYGTAASSTSNYCGGTTKSLGNLLAATASSTAAGASVNDGCATSAARATENADGDNYFCAATSAELQDVFTAAVGQATGSTKFMKIDGISN
jgi:Flp pilus assembly protein TadG